MRYIRFSLPLVALLVITLVMTLLIMAAPVLAVGESSSPAQPINWLELVVQIAAVMTTVITWGLKKIFRLEGLNALALNAFLNVIGKGVVLYFTGVYGVPGTQQALLIALAVTFAGFGIDQGAHVGIKRAERSSRELRE